MASKIRRISSQYTFSITNSSATSKQISFNDEAVFVLYTPSGWTSCTLTVYAKNHVTGTWLPLVYNGSAVAFTAAATTAYAIHESIFGCHDIMFISDNALNNALVCGGTSKG
jgi:hypothetical protein